MNILIGITGSISAYKMLDAISMFRKKGHSVKVILTESSRMFVTEMAMSVISNMSVITDYSNDFNGYVEHVQLAEWADVMLIAPATANTISKMVTCQLDNPLMCTYSVFVGKKGYDKLVVAPAMNTHMYHMCNDVGNIRELKGRGVRWISPQEGILACGEDGTGKLQKIDIIVNITESIGYL